MTCAAPQELQWREDSSAEQFAAKRQRELPAALWTLAGRKQCSDVHTCLVLVIGLDGNRQGGDSSVIGIVSLLR